MAQYQQEAGKYGLKNGTKLPCIQHLPTLAPRPLISVFGTDLSHWHRPLGGFR